MAGRVGSGDPEADGWRAGRFGTDAPATAIPIPYDGAERLAWWRAKREGERVRAMLGKAPAEPLRAEDPEDRREGRARAFLLGSA